jgi:PII-like signaling protein
VSLQRRGQHQNPRRDARCGGSLQPAAHAKVLNLSEDLPVVVGIVDVEAQIRSFLEAIAPMMGSSLVTLEKVQVLRYGP